MTMGEVRQDTAKAARFSASALSTGAFDALPPHAEHDLPLPKAPETAIIARNSPGIGGMSTEYSGEQRNSL
jgi:hypothetical protein